MSAVPIPVVLVAHFDINADDPDAVFHVEMRRHAGLPPHLIAVDVALRFEADPQGRLRALNVFTQHAVEDVVYDLDRPGEPVALHLRDVILPYECSAEEVALVFGHYRQAGWSLDPAAAGWEARWEQARRYAAF